MYDFIKKVTKVSRVISPQKQNSLLKNDVSQKTEAAKIINRERGSVSNEGKSKN